MQARRKAIWVAVGCVAGVLSPLWWARYLDGPWGMIPGGAFRGVDEPCTAAAWQELQGVEELEVEVHPARPRSVTTWSVVHEGDLFVPADFLTPWKRWPLRVMEDDRIRVRVGARIFRCRGERVRDVDTIAALRGAAAAKYGLDPDGLAGRSEVWWFRVVPR